MELGEGGEGVEGEVFYKFCTNKSSSHPWIEQREGCIWSESEGRKSEGRKSDAEPCNGIAQTKSPAPPPFIFVVSLAKSQTTKVY